MLVYVFWHTPRSGAAPGEYAGALAAFQSAFGRTGLARGIQSFRLDPVGWFQPEAACYIDCYEIESSAQLEAINEAAVSGGCAVPHQAIAALAGAGMGSLYRYEHRGCAVSEAGHSVWFSKPEGMSYAELRGLLSPLHGADNAVLQRFLALGGSPEFCLLSKSETALPDGLAGCHRALTKI